MTYNVFGGTSSINQSISDVGDETTAKGIWRGDDKQGLLRRHARAVTHGRTSEGRSRAGVGYGRESLPLITGLGSFEGITTGKFWKFYVQNGVFWGAKLYFVLIPSKHQFWPKLGHKMVLSVWLLTLASQSCTVPVYFTAMIFICEQPCWHSSYSYSIVLPVSVRVSGCLPRAKKTEKPPVRS